MEFSRQDLLSLRVVWRRRMSEETAKASGFLVLVCGRKPQIEFLFVRERQILQDSRWAVIP